MEVRQFLTIRRELNALRQWLADEEVTHVAMESTGSYWKPGFQRSRRPLHGVPGQSGRSEEPQRTQDRQRDLPITDFDQTLSFHDSGLVLSELPGVRNFLERAVGPADIHLVQQGAELSYPLPHDSDFRRVRRHHPVQAGKYVLSAAPEEAIQSALAKFRYNPHSGEIRSTIRVPAGYGKLEAIDHSRDSLEISPTGARMPGFFNSHGFAQREGRKTRTGNVTVCPALVKTTTREATV